MSSVHYPTLMASSKVPYTGHMKEAPSVHYDSTKTSARSRSHYTDSPSKRRLPPVTSSSRDADYKVASPKHRNSMAEVVARMRVREKTLLGEDPSLRRKDSSGLNGGVNLNGERNRPSRTSGASSGVPGALNFRGTPFGPEVDVAQFNGPAEFFVSHKGGFAPTNSRTRKVGVVTDTAALANSDSVPVAWGTPRDPPNHNERSSTHSHALEIRGAANHLGARDLVVNGGSKDVQRFHQSVRNGWRKDDGVDYIAEEEEEEEEEDGEVGEKDGGGENGDSDFDFDEGEEEVEAQKKTERASHATAAVYKRACTRLMIQPSPAFLRQCNLSTMDLRDVRLGPNDVKPIAIALVRDNKVMFLDLSNNDLGPVGVSYIAEMLQENCTLMDLNLSATNPGREGVKALSETLRHNRTLVHLRLEENKIEHTESHLIADMIKSVPTLQGLHLGHNRLGYYGGTAIAAALTQNQTLSVLDLQWNHIRRDSAVALIRALAKNQRLRRLNLAWNGLGKEGCLALAYVLSTNTTLLELDLTCNRVDLMSLGFLLKGLARNKSLKTLKIGQNPLTTDGAKALLRTVASVPDMELSELDVTGVPVDLEFTEQLSRLQKRRALHVKHEEAITLATSDQTREHDGTNLDRYDPLMVLFEYMKMDNLRVIDIFQFMDSRHREKLSKSDIRDGLNTLKIPVTEHAIDVMYQKLDLNKDGFVELDEMMKVQRDTARQVKLRQIKAKAKNKEDQGLNGLHKILREVISKRKEENDAAGGERSSNRRDSNVSKTSVGGRKASIGGLQLTGARYSVTSTKRKSKTSGEQKEPGGDDDSQEEQPLGTLESIQDEESVV